MPANKKIIPIISLITSNLFPLYGVMYLGWKIGDIMALYWIENVIIGVFNIPKILLAQFDPGNLIKIASKQMISVAAALNKISTVIFYIIHYGGFSLGHGLFVYVLFIENALAGQRVDPPTLQTILHIITELKVAIVLLFASHLLSFVQNTIGKKEYLTKNVNQAMFDPYKRVLILHVTLIIGASATAIFHHQIAALIILIILKIFVDMTAHIQSHQINRVTVTHDNQVNFNN